ncbi:MAG: S8 family serine peptidase, partial [Dehalococcoidia bacterium]|nr:S8 family serine peptidase [Dehalococcoidia bacterium]
MPAWRKLGLIAAFALTLALMPVSALGQEPDDTPSVGLSAVTDDLEVAFAQGRLDEATYEAALSGDSFEAIVILDDSLIQASSAARRGTRGLVNDDPTELRLKRADISNLKRSTFSSAVGVQVLGDPESFALTHVRLPNAFWLAVLLRIPSVSSVVANTRYEATLAQSLPLIGQPAAATAGFTGAGTAVAVLDTGLDYTRDAFDTRANLGCTAPNSPSNTCRVVYTHDFAPDDGSLDDNGHGTNVAGIALGVAPDAKIIGLDVFQGGSAYSTDIIAAMNWVVQNKATYNIVSVNLSLGDSLHVETCSNSWAASSFASLRSAGIIPVVAAGNSAVVNGSFSPGVSGPGCAPGALSVGAVYDSNFGGVSFSSCTDSTTAADKITCFSQTANSLGLLAPGGAITAAGITMYGTSQATPHVAGAVAVLAQANPNSSADQRVAALTGNGPQITDTRPSPSITKRRLDLCAAISGVGASCSGGGPTPTPTPSPSPSPTPGGTIASDGFESGTTSGGTGWNGNWTFSGSYTSIITSSSPPEGSRQLLMRSWTSMATRTVVVPSGGATLK